MYLVCSCFCLSVFFFFKQKTAYEMRISDWSSDVCSSDLVRTFEVYNLKTDANVGLLYLDNFARDGKRSGAWMTTYRSQQTLGEIGRASCRDRVCQYV